MNSLVQASILAWMTCTVIAAPSSNPKLGIPAVLEQIVVPSDWTSIGAPSPDSRLKLQIGLKQKDIKGLQRKLMDISNHNSPNYGKWLSKKEVESFTAPSEETIKMVKSWLEAAGIPASAVSQPTPDWLHIDVPVKTAEQMLSTKYSVYKDNLGGSSLVRAPKYSVPQLLHDHIDTIQPTTAFQRNMAPAPHSEPDTTTGKVVRDDASSCAQTATPSCIRNYYNVDYTGTGRALVGVTGLIGQSASHSDLTSFLQNYDSQTTGDFTDVSVSNATIDPSNPGGEANLDVQQAFALGAPNPFNFYALGPNDGSNSNFVDELINLGTYLNSVDSPPTAISTSYGSSEPSNSGSYAQRICDEFAKAGSRGISVFFSTGDYGVGRKGQSCSSFVTHFPATCPYVTAVGATSFTSDGSSETAAVWRSGLASGGGFSYLFSAPDYQKNDTSSYVQNSVPSSYDGLYNSGGRGYPDVALIGTKVPQVLNGKLQKVLGTSASTPMWAGLISQINDYRLSKGLSTLGFLNQRLYNDPNVRAALNDITVGNNPGCGTDGFSATTGWDPASGLGTMNFGKLRAALSS